MQSLNDQFQKSEVIFHLTNVARQHDVENAFREVLTRFKAIDLVITCAGILDEHSYEEMVNVNLVGINFAQSIQVSHCIFLVSSSLVCYIQIISLCHT